MLVFVLLMPLEAALEAHAGFLADTAAKEYKKREEVSKAVSRLRKLFEEGCNFARTHTCSLRAAIIIVPRQDVARVYRLLDGNIRQYSMESELQGGRR